MSIVKWSPMRELLSIQNNMNQLFEESFGKHFKGDKFAEQTFEPLVDIYEDKDKIEINAELPGIIQKDVKIDIEGNVLSIKGERKFDNEEKKGNYHRVERYYGSFARTFSLPSTIDQDNVKASFDKGVLKITLPKKEEVKPKQIPIEAK